MTGDTRTKTENVHSTLFVLTHHYYNIMESSLRVKDPVSIQFGPFHTTIVPINSASVVRLVESVCPHVVMYITNFSTVLVVAVS